MKSNSKINVRFEETEEARRILSSLSESLQQIRRENEYNGELKILMCFSKKNQTKYYTTPFEKDLDNLIIRKKPDTRQVKSTDIILPQIQRQQGFIHTNPPKN